MEIKTKNSWERIAVSIDNDEDEQGDFVVMLYVPHTKHPEHEHIEFDKEAAIQLRDFLTEFIGDKK